MDNGIGCDLLRSFVASSMMDAGDKKTKLRQSASRSQGRALYISALPCLAYSSSNKPEVQAECGFHDLPFPPFFVPPATFNDHEKSGPVSASLGDPQRISKGLNSRLAVFG